MKMHNTWEKARELGFKEGFEKGFKEKFEEGFKEGVKMGMREPLLRQLRARFGELPAAAVDRLQAADTAELEQWADRVLSAKTLAEVLCEPS